MQESKVLRSIENTMMNGGSESLSHLFSNANTSASGKSAMKQSLRSGVNRLSKRMKKQRKAMKKSMNLTAKGAQDTIDELNTDTPKQRGMKQITPDPQIITAPKIKTPFRDFLDVQNDNKSPLDAQSQQMLSLSGDEFSQFDQTIMDASLPQIPSEVYGKAIRSFRPSKCKPILRAAQQKRLRMKKTLKIKKSPAYLDSSPDWEVLQQMMSKGQIPIHGNGHPWNPGFMNMFYMHEEQVQTLYRNRKQEVPPPKIMPFNNRNMEWHQPTRIEKMIKAAEKTNKISERHHIQSKVKYFLWTWRQRSLGRSQITADMRYLRFQRKKEIANKEDSDTEMDEDQFLQDQLKEELIQKFTGQQKKVVKKYSEHSENSIAFRVFLGFLNMYFTMPNQTTKITNFISGQHLALSHGDLWLKAMTFEAKCDFAYKLLRELIDSTTNQKFGYLKQEFQDFFKKQIREIHVIRVNAIKAVTMSHLRPELQQQNFGGSVKAQISNRNIKLDLFPAKYVHKSPANIENDYDAKIGNVIQVLKSLQGVMDFKGISSLWFQERELKAVMSALENQTLRKLHTLLSIQDDEFHMCPTFKLPEPGNKHSQRAYQMIIKKRERQTYTIGNSEEEFTLAVDDNLIGPVTCAYLDLQRRRRLELVNQGSTDEDEKVIKKTDLKNQKRNLKQYFKQQYKCLMAHRTRSSSKAVEQKGQEKPVQISTQFMTLRKRRQTDYHGPKTRNRSASKKMKT